MAGSVEVSRWDHDDTTVYDYAKFVLAPIARLRELEEEEAALEA